MTHLPAPFLRGLPRLIEYKGLIKRDQVSIISDYEVHQLPHAQSKKTLCRDCQHTNYDVPRREQFPSGIDYEHRDGCGRITRSPTPPPGVGQAKNLPLFGYLGALQK